MAYTDVILLKRCERQYRHYQNTLRLVYIAWTRRDINTKHICKEKISCLIPACAAWLKYRKASCSVKTENLSSDRFLSKIIWNRNYCHPHIPTRILLLPLMLLAVF